MENIHFQILKNYFDEIIVNQGVLRIENPEVVVEKVKLDYLVKLAFRFYAKLYTNQVVSIYKNKWDWFKCANCKEKCSIFSDTINEDLDLKEISKHCCDPDKNKAELRCINCGQNFLSLKPDTPEEQNSYMPLCKICDSEIGNEIEIWEKLFEG